MTGLQSVPLAEAKAAPAWKGARSKKRLASSAEATALNRAYTARMWQDIANGESFVFGYGPMELFNAMDLYLVLPVQYGSVMAAKQLFEHYQGAIDDRGYFRSLANYESLPLGYCFNPDPETAPYGGLPKPSAIVGGYMTEPAIYELYAREFGSPIYLMDDPHRQASVPPRWWEGRDWRNEDMINFNVREFEGCVRFLESVTGKPYSETRLREYLRRADEMAEYYWKITDLAYKSAGPAPFTASEAYTEVGIFETHFGHEWALDHVKGMYREVKDKVENREAAVEGERIRLLWGGTPLWFNLGFYNAWEESHGAIFVETMYLPRAQRMMQPDRSNALRAAYLRRHMKYTGPSPKSAAELVVAQSRDYRIDGVVLPARGATRESSASSRFMAEALRREGIPALFLDYSPFDNAAWDEEAMRAQVTEFIEQIEGSR
ncbi:2-hydroxyacyl-CoA dehydratase family protein [Arthrobacter sp. 35W]|uniref:2-hydroxyacyl-CoA dehydratase family protein n=1 Tax=Arthrobacter sp. 35W TaxID=1132441 RepID=UPI00040D3FB9|nr:2-hydroxyacyl-CoA dehydratase family protein [Arthrobacter sp. 35W]